MRKTRTILLLLIYTVLSDKAFAHKTSQQIFPKPQFSFAKERPVSHFDVSQIKRTEILYASKPETDSLTSSKIKRKAKWAKWLGIGSLVGLLIPGVNLLSLPAAIAAIVSSHQISKESEYANDAVTGRRTGWLTIGFLVVIGFIVAIVVIIPVGPR